MRQEFIQNVSPFGNKACMRGRERDAKQRGDLVSVWKYFFEEYCVGLEPRYDVFVARHAHLCVR